MDKPILAVVAVAVPGRRAASGAGRRRYLRKVDRRVEAEFGPDSDATVAGPRRRSARSCTPPSLYARARRVASLAGGARRPRRGRPAATPSCSCPVGVVARATAATSSARPGSSRSGPRSSGGPRRCSRQEELAPAALGRAPRARRPARLRRLRGRPGVPGRHRADGRRLLRRVPRRADTGWPRSSAT